jgi:hypothetical protein
MRTVGGIEISEAFVAGFRGVIKIEEMSWLISIARFKI